MEALSYPLCSEISCLALLCSSFAVWDFYTISEISTQLLAVDVRVGRDGTACAFGNEATSSYEYLINGIIPSLCTEEFTVQLRVLCFVYLGLSLSILYRAFCWSVTVVGLLYKPLQYILGFHSHIIFYQQQTFSFLFLKSFLNIFSNTDFRQILSFLLAVNQQ